MMAAGAVMAEIGIAARPGKICKVRVRYMP